MVAARQTQQLHNHNITIITQALLAKLSLSCSNRLFRSKHLTCTQLDTEAWASCSISSNVGGATQHDSTTASPL
jgi:hypothetical protein